MAATGFDTSANELSPYMNYTFKFLCSFNKKYSSPSVIHPYAHWFSHQTRNSATFRAVEFPDTVPRLSDNFRLLDYDFLKIQEAGRYDYIVTQFFIDTSLNVIETLEHIHSLLRPGGQWINLGPLLWTGGGQAAVELSLEEVLKLATMIGFDVADDDVQRPPAAPARLEPLANTRLRAVSPPVPRLSCSSRLRGHPPR